MPERQFDLKIRVSAKDAASGALGGITSSLQKLGIVAIAGIGAVGSGVAYIANQAIPAASDLNESLNASGVVFGEAADIIQDFGKMSAEAVGMSEAAFNQLAAQTGAMLQNYGLNATEAANATVDLGQRAADMASIFNTDVSEAMTAINAAMRGEADPIERFGVSMNAAAVEAKALEMGFQKVGKTFDQAALTQARLALLMEQTDTIAGDFANTSGDLANATRINQARWEDFMAKVGALGLPIMTTLQGILADIGDWAIPLVGDAINNLLPAVENIADSVSTFVSALLSGEDPIGTLTALLRDLGLDEIATTIETIMPSIEEFIAKASEVLAPLFEWIQNNISLGDVLIGLGVAIASVVIPIIGSLLSTIAPIIAIFAAVVLAVALLRSAWENDFLGIRTALTEVWEKKLVPAFKYFQDELMPKINRIIEYFGVLWEQKIIPILDKLGIKMGGDNGGLGDIIGNVLGAAIDLIVMSIEGWIIIFEELAPFITNLFTNVEKIVDAFIRFKDWIGRVGQALGSLRLPDWLTPGSPTPLELGVLGITDAMDELSKKQLPSLANGLGITSPLSPSLAGAGAGGAAGGETVQIVIPITLDGREVGYGTVEGTLDALRQRGISLRGAAA